MAGRRIGLYFAWSRPEENFGDPETARQFTQSSMGNLSLAHGATPGILENRYPALYEFRRATYPHFEHLKEPEKFQQDITGFLQHVILRDFKDFQKEIYDVTREPAILAEPIERLGNKPPVQQLDRDFLDRFDTLIVVSLDHFRTNQIASPAEIEAMRDFLRQENRCLFICPHHEIGRDDVSQQSEFFHHHDITIPSQQQIGGFARTLLQGLGIAVENQWGLNPEAQPDGSPTPLVRFLDLDDAKLLEGVDTFNLHPHLPHLQFAPELAGEVDVLARQLINPKAPPHPFVEAGHRDFNALLRLRPKGLAGRVYVGDATLWSAVFGGLSSLKRFWRNIANMK